MAQIAFLDVIVCDATKDELPYDETIDAFTVPFRPKSGRGRTEQLYLKVICSLTPASPTQVKFLLRIKNLSDFRFTMGDSETIQYFRELTHRQPVYLPFAQMSLTSIDKCLLDRLILTVRDDNNPDNNPQRTIRIKGY